MASLINAPAASKQASLYPGRLFIINNENMFVVSSFPLTKEKEKKTVERRKF
jgi:hypothetical protein